MTDPLSRVTTMVYDAQNRVSQQRLPDPDGAGPLGVPTTSYAYDLAGQLTSITDPVNNVTGYVYDNAGRVKQVNHPGGTSTLYTFNAADEVTRVTDRNGRHRDFTYSDLGLPLTEKWRNSDETLVRTISMTYDDAGRMLTASDPDSSYAYTYDLGNMVTKVDNSLTPGVPDVILNYAYDYAGNRTAVTDNLGNTITYGYLNHRLSSMTYSTLESTIAQVDFGYDSIGRLTTIDRLSGTQPSIRTAFSYDDLDRVKQIKHTRETGTPVTLSQFDYTFDVASQITQYVGPEGTLNYSYDNTGQLTGVTGARTESYSFDVNGNRTMSGYSTTTGNRLSSDGVYNYTYDNEGNIVTKTKISNGEVTTFTFDHRNRMTKAELRTSGGTLLKEQRNTYDLQDRRIGVWEDDNGDGVGTQRWTAYDGANPYADFNGSGSLTKRYLYGPAIDWLFARIGATGDLDWYLTDRLDSVRQIVDIDGTVLNALTYDSFGKPLTETNPANGDRFTYTGRESDKLFALLFYRARYYSFDIGRFISSDPIGFASGDTNLYRYVGNGPTNATDPSGLQGQIRTVPTLGGYQTFTEPEPTPPSAPGDILEAFALLSTRTPLATMHLGDDVYVAIFERGDQKVSVTYREIHEPDGNAAGTRTVRVPVRIGSYNAAGTWPASTSNDRIFQLVKDNYEAYHSTARYWGYDATWVPIWRNSIAAADGRYVAAAVGAVEDSLFALPFFRARQACNTGTNAVYRSVNAAGQVQYVGITNNFARRAAEHLRSRGFAIERLFGNLSRADARAVEQALIEIHGLARNGATLLNRINSIAPTSPTYADWLRRGHELLRSIGY